MLHPGRFRSRPRSGQVPRQRLVPLLLVSVSLAAAGPSTGLAASRYALAAQEAPVASCRNDILGGAPNNSYLTVADSGARYHVAGGIQVAIPFSELLEVNVELRKHVPSV